MDNEHSHCYLCWTEIDTNKELTLLNFRGKLRPVCNGCVEEFNKFMEDQGFKGEK